MKNKYFVVIALLLGIGLFSFLVFRSKTQDSASINTVDSRNTQVNVEASETFVRPHSPRFGNSLARVTVVEWFDPECESCRAIHPIVKRILAEYGNRIFFVYRYMPFHSGSMYAASVLEEAKEMGKFDEALAVLFEKQPEWGSHHQPRSDLIPSYLLKIGIPPEKLQREAVIAKHGDKIRLDEEDGKKVGVEATPTFYVNGHKLTEIGEQPLRQAIELALSAKGN